MSEPIRYDFEQAELNKSAGFYVRKEGHWVRWDDHATALQEIQRLKAEVERLTQNTDKLCKHGDLEIERLKAEVEAHEKRWAESEDLISHYKQQRDEAYNDCQCHRLKAEVERLRKAGDAMCKFFDDHGFYGFGFQEAWNAAKEGKQP